MKQSFINYSLLSFMLSFLFFGCKKKEDDPINVLTAKVWKYSTVDKNPGGTGSNINSPFNWVSECEKDNTFQFDKNGKLHILNGSIKCNSEEKVTRTVNYSYDAKTKELLLDGVKCEVLELSRQQFKYKAPISYSTGYVHVLIILE